MKSKELENPPRFVYRFQGKKGAGRFISKKEYDRRVKLGDTRVTPYRKDKPGKYVKAYVPERPKPKRPARPPEPVKRRPGRPPKGEALPKPKPPRGRPPKRRKALPKPPPPPVPPRLKTPVLDPLRIADLTSELRQSAKQETKPKTLYGVRPVKGKRRKRKLGEYAKSTITQLEVHYQTLSPDAFAGPQRLSPWADRRDPWIVNTRISTGRADANFKVAMKLNEALIKGGESGDRVFVVAKLKRGNDVFYRTIVARQPIEELTEPFEEDEE